MPSPSALSSLRQHWKSLRKKDRISLVVLLVLLVALPVAVILVQIGTRLLSRAFPVTPPVTNPVTPPVGTQCAPDNQKIIRVYPGGSGEDCEDLQAAVNAVNGSGFTVKLSPGMHSAPAPLVGHNIVIEGKENLRIDGTTENGSIGASLLINPRSSVYKGILVKNSSVHFLGLDISGTSDGELIRLENANNTAITTTILKNPEGGLLQIYQSNNVEIHESEFLPAGNGIDMYMSEGFVLRSSRIIGGSGSLMMSRSGGLVEYNLITQSTQEGIFITDTKSVDILHNLVVENVSEGASIPAVYILDDIDGTVKIENNVIAYNTVGIAVNDIQNVQYNYNDIWSNTENFAGGITLTGEGNISADPGLGTNPEYCIYRNSPTVVYGDVENGEYMGWNVFCHGEGGTPSLILNIKLQGISGEGPDKKATLVLNKVGGGTNTYESQILENTAQGVYSLKVYGVPAGTYTMVLKPETYLAKNLGEVTVVEGQGTQPPLFTSAFLAGDVNGDNKLNIFDVATILTQYTALSVPAEAGTEKEKYDINGDGIISIFDIAIVLTNYTALVIEGD